MSVKIFGNGKIEGVAVEKKRIEAFTGSGTFTIPAGVTYAIAHMLGGGGGVGRASAGNGSASSVAFVSGTVQSNGGTGHSNNTTGSVFTAAGQANSGRGAQFSTNNAGDTRNQGSFDGLDAQYVVAGASVTPAEEITVTVGAGGAAGTNGAAGGSGYVYIEYFEEA